MATQTTSYQMHTQVPVKRHRLRHLVALLGVPAAVFGLAFLAWTLLKEQCLALSAEQCLPVGPVVLGGTDVAVLAALLTVGLAIIVEVAHD